MEENTVHNKVSIPSYEIQIQDPTKKEKKERIRSDVWQFFTKLDNVKAICEICNKTYSHSGNTTNLFWHLKRKHQMEVGSVSLPSSTSKTNSDSMDHIEKFTPSKRGRSEVWQYFTKEDGKTARCLICDKILSHSGNTSNLFSHVKHKHKDVVGNILPGEISMEECPTEILPDDSHSEQIVADIIALRSDVKDFTDDERLCNEGIRISEVISEKSMGTPIILRRKRKNNDECNMKFVEACSKALENEMKSNEIGYEVVSLNGEPKYIKEKENGVRYITKVVPKSSSPVVIGEYDAVGLNVGAKLKKMEPNQAIFAESLINRILLRGLMETLTSETDLYDKNVYVIQNIDDRSHETISYDSPIIESGVEVTHA